MTIAVSQANHFIVSPLPAYLKRFDLSHPKFAFV